MKTFKKMLTKFNRIDLGKAPSNSKIKRRNVKLQKEVLVSDSIIDVNKNKSVEHEHSKSQNTLNIDKIDIASSTEDFEGTIQALKSSSTYLKTTENVLKLDEATDTEDLESNDNSSGNDSSGTTSKPISRKAFCIIGTISLAIVTSLTYLIYRLTSKPV